VVEEDEDEEETVRVGLKLWPTDTAHADLIPDNTQEIRDVVCERYVLRVSFILAVLRRFWHC